jgi:RNA polymerase sigma factor (TIGR02999 family)
LSDAAPEASPPRRHPWLYNATISFNICATVSNPADPSPSTPDSTPQNASDILPQVYDELRALARHRMSQENVGHTLQATALVHEAYMRLGPGGQFASRAHFFKAAAHAMRNILIEYARSKGRLKRGGPDAKRLPINVLDLAALPDSGEILALDEAISRLESEMPLAASIVRLRFYAGLGVAETAETLDISPRTVNREWTYARAWLFSFLDEKKP